MVGLKDTGEPSRAHDAEFQRSGQAQQVIPVLDDQLGVDPVRREVVQHTVIGLSIDTPEPRAADIGDARRELEPEEVENAENRVGIAGRIRSEEHTSELQSLMRISYAVFCLKKKKRNKEQK